MYDFRANIEGAEKIFQLFKPLLEKSDANLVKELEADFKSVNSLLDKHMTDKEHYKLYTDLTKEDTKELSELWQNLVSLYHKWVNFLVENKSYDWKRRKVFWKKMDRREFLKKAGIGGAGLALGLSGASAFSHLS